MSLGITEFNLADHGIEAVNSELEKVAKDVRLRAAKEGIYAAGSIIKQEAERLAPVRQKPYGGYRSRRRTGRLAKSIELKIYTGYYVDGVVSVRERYGHLVEWGHKTRASRAVLLRASQRAGRRVRRRQKKLWVEGRRFMRDAIDDKKDAAFEAMAVAIEREIFQAGN